MNIIREKRRIRAIWLCTLLLVLGTQADASRIGRKGTAFTLNDGPYNMWGIEISAAALSDENTEQAIDALNTYVKYGVSTIALSFQPAGCGRGVFAADGSIGDQALFDRIMRLTRAAEERWMISALRVFSPEPSARLEPAACKRALEDLGHAFRGRTDVVMNIGFASDVKTLPESVRVLRNGKRGFSGLVGVDLNSISKESIVSAEARDSAKSLDVVFCDGSPETPIANPGLDKPVVVAAVVEDPQKPGNPHPKMNEFTQAIAKSNGTFLIARIPSFCEGSSTRFDIGGQYAKSGIGIAWYLQRVCDVQLSLHGPIEESMGGAPDLHLLDPGEKEEGFVPLFDGRTLQGWTMLSDSWHSFSVADGVIACDGTSPNAYLRTARQYSDFVLRLEVKISEGGNSGVFIRAPLWGRSSRVGFETQVLGGSEPDPVSNAGAVYGVLAPKVDAMKPIGEWNAFEIACQGEHVRIKLNGKLIQDFDMGDIPAMKDRLREGVIGLQDHRCKVWFRRIRLKEL
ncbi:MAG: DUF1080 domain-containing protein [bacterium]